MNKNLIDKFIAMPLAVTVFKQDQNQFKSFKMRNLYLDKLDAVIDRMEKDFYSLKQTLISKYHLDVKVIDQCTYNVNGKVIEYTPEEMKLMTSEVMHEYLFKVKEFERKERIWNV
ncbi:hypothetical protein [Virgibacillus alimentarius]|uniref:hypothetical protein n=1 Tax=Virgibacillus alimentarius TaxID=698769 RepID=UPI0004936723|nr:hypothetical protein [Virgibacillus alimentarius]